MSELPSLEEIARALGGEVHGDKVLAPGPDHTPADRSLLVRLSQEASDGLFVHSFADDDAIACKDYVRTQISLPAFKPKVTKIPFDYRDPETGACRYRKIRCEKAGGTKTFYFEKPSRNGVAPLLYGGEDVADLEEDRPVWIVEGEKSVEALRRRGQVAVSGDTGAKSKWRPEHAQLLANRRIIFWPDSDQDGEKYIHSAASAIRAENPDADLRVVRPFPLNGGKGKDVCDWVGGAEELAALVESAKPYKLARGNGLHRTGARAETKHETGKQTDFIRGQILKGNPRNIRLAIDKLGVTFKQNDFSGRPEVYGLPGFGPELSDAGAIRLRLWIEESFAFLPSQLLFDQIVSDMAHAARYHPVREYLDGLKWDGVPRIDNWLHDYGGAEDTPFNRAVARIFLVAGVRRIRDPGAKFDTMLVFESPQGKDKSKALRTLAVCDEWFTDNLPLGAATKEVIEQTRGVWIAEFAELSGIERRDVNHVKSFLSKQEDRARAAYGRRTENVLRQFITAGSTNDAQYLLDIENRRFWPVTINRFNTAKLRAAVAQLWAEAANYEATGESITLQEDLWADAAVEQAAREIESPVKESLAARLGREKPGWIPAGDVWEIIAVSLEQRQRLSKVVGQAMTALGFSRKQVTAGDDKKGDRGDRFYERGEGGERIRWRGLE